MHIIFHGISFTHSCGLQGTILEVCARADGTLSLNGLCAVCGEQFSEDYKWSDVMVSCTIKDYVRHRMNNPEVQFADFATVGKPN